MPRPLIANRRERLLDAAEQLILDRGFDAMSVSALATAAGIGKGAVYLEFAGKRDILDAVLQRANLRMAERVRTELGERPRLSDACRATVRALRDDRMLTAAYLDDRGVLGAHLDTVDDGRFRIRHLGVVDWIVDLKERGAVRADVDPAALALAISSATIGLLSAARLIGPLSADELESGLDVIASMVQAFETPRSTHDAQ